MIIILILAVFFRFAFAYFTQDSLLANFSPLFAIVAMFGAFIGNRKDKIIATLVLLFCSDFLINFFIYNSSSIFYQGMGANLLSLIVILFVSSALLKKKTYQHLLLNAVVISCIHFFISNFSVWLSGQLYPVSIAGLFTCFINALPFFKNTLLSNAFFSVILFFLAQRFFQKFSLPQSKK